MKQFFDIAQLYEKITSIEDVFYSYKRCHDFENTFRGTTYTIEETLLDTFNHAAEIASMGLWNKKSAFYNDVARVGMQGLISNIFEGTYNQPNAVADASKVMYLVACLLTNSPLIKSEEEQQYKGGLMKPFRIISDKNAFVLIRKAITLLVNAKII